MRVVCVWREESEHGRTVREWLNDFERQTGREIENINPDENAAFCNAYDVVEYPTILALHNDGTVAMSWRGASMPRIDDVLFYML